MRNISTASRVVRIASAFGLLLAVALLAACTSGTPAASNTPPAEEPVSSAPAETPTVKLVEPVDGAALAAGTVKVTVESTGLEFTMPSNTNVAGQGHVHFTLDDRPFVMSVEKSAEIKDVEPGKHTLVAELVQNNTEPFDPPIEDEIEFVVE